MIKSQEKIFTVTKAAKESWNTLRIRDASAFIPSQIAPSILVIGLWIADISLSDPRHKNGVIYEVYLVFQSD